MSKSEPTVTIPIRHYDEMEDCRKALESRIAELEKAQEWVSVEDEKPFVGQMVLVESGVALYQKDDVWNSVTGSDWPGRPIQWAVRFWKPLPTPPREAGK